MAGTKISVLTVVYNGADTIVDCLKSVASQTYPNIEHVIQDGDSSDGTVDRIRSNYSGSHFVSERDAGIYDGLNRAVLRSTGEVVGVLHSDDIYATHTILARIAEVFDDENIDAVYGDLHMIRWLSDGRRKVVRKWVAGEGELSRGWMPPHPSFFIRRDALLRNGLYDTSFRIAGDYEAMIRWIVKGRIRCKYLPITVSLMTIGGASNAGFRSELEKLREDYRAITSNGIGGVGCLLLKKLRKLAQVRI